MRKTLCLLAALFPVGCAGAKTELKPLKVEIDNTYGTAIVSWEKPEGEDLHYELLIHTLSGSDAGKAGEKIAVLTTDQESCRIADHIAYYAQEKDYYGPAAVQVTAYDGEKPAAQGESDVLMAEECLPAEKELFIGEDIDPADIILLSYSGSGESRSDNFTFCLTDDGDEITLEANISDETTDLDVYETVNREVFDKALTYLEGGKLVRKYVSDPELQMLDGSEQQFTVWWNSMTEVQRSCYEFEPSEENREKLKEYLKQISLEVNNQ